MALREEDVRWLSRALLRLGRGRASCGPSSLSVLLTSERDLCSTHSLLHSRGVDTWDDSLEGFFAVSSSTVYLGSCPHVGGRGGRKQVTKVT